MIEDEGQKQVKALKNLKLEQQTIEGKSNNEAIEGESNNQKLQKYLTILLKKERE